MTDLTHIKIFKTNIKTAEDKLRIENLFKNNPLIEEWSVDCDDVDCVLRVVSRLLTTDQIIEQINMACYECQELE